MQFNSLPLWSYAKQFILTFLTFLVIDFAWLGFVAKDVYAHYVGSIMREQPNGLAAMLFYVIYVVGILVFVVYPHKKSPYKKVGMYGAAFGLVAYATFDLTALAVLKGWSVPLTVIDLVWGMVLTASVSLVSAHILRR